MAFQSFRDMVAWQKAMELSVAVYEATAAFPKGEQFGLTSQMRRIVVSVPSKIAEGQGRGAHDDFRRLLFIARGSLYELETQLILSERLAYLTEEQTKPLVEQCNEVAKIINGLIRSLS